MENKFVWLDPEKKYSDKEKQYIANRLELEMLKKSSVSVIYTPDCGCPIETLFILDRYPMSEKIHSTCMACGKSCLMEISDPIRFHIPILDLDINIYDLKDVEITSGPQEDLLLKYQADAILFH